MTLFVRVLGTRGSFELDVELELMARGISVIFGSSGSGKTTLLRCLAGLEQLHGRVVFNGSVWQDSDIDEFVLPERRRIGYVFQEALLFPHLSVLDNLRFGHQRARVESGGISIESAARRLEIEKLLDRRPATLSGGERQRVAVARALAQNPQLLLMDEPLASLDAPARASILGHLEELHEELEVPVIYVTHAVDELVRLADRVVWLEQGHVQGVGSAAETLASPLGARLGDEAGGVVEATVRRHDETYHLTELDSAWGSLFIHRLERATLGDPVRLRIRARDVAIALAHDDRSSVLNTIAARIVALEPAAPGETLVRLDCPTDPRQMLLARVTQKSVDSLELCAGREVFLRIKSVSLGSAR